MKLLRYRVTNYRSVVDSGWIDLNQVTALIGVNESGKTNLLLPLWKLNPAREGEISPTSDYPKANYAAIREAPQDYKFIEAEFDTSGLAPKLAQLSGAAPRDLQKVIVRRAFDGSYSFEFPDFTTEPQADYALLSEAIKTALAEVGAMSALSKEGSLKVDSETLLRGAFTENRPISLADLDAFIDSIKDLLPGTPAATSSIVPRLQRLIEDLEQIAAPLRVADPAENESVQALLRKEMPKFVFYSNYGNLDSEIYLPHVVDNLSRKDLGAKEAAKARTLRVLFSFVRLSPEDILELGKDFEPSQGQRPSDSEIAEIAQRKRERTILLNSAGTELTKKFKDWWKQGDYTFEFQADGDHFRIWVSDSRRPEKIELEDRSSGLQWFLSFYLIFLVESGRDHKGAILLLDEPGLSLHPLAQHDLSAFFNGLADTNQLIYTTHSPFLVDADSLDRVRKVFVAPDGSTKASSDLRRGHENPRKNGATYAIYSALNMSVAESLLLGCHPVIVEGPSDQHYLSAIKQLLIASGNLNPARELVFAPAHGAPNARALASILSGRDEVMPPILLDDDAAGSKMARDLKNGPYQTQQEKVMQTKEWIEFAESEVEDLFPAAFVAEVLDRIERRPSTPFSDVVQNGQAIVPQIEKWASEANISLADSWKVDLAREVKQRALQKGAAFFADSMTAWKEMFGRLGS
ncbi:AAA family ATPase [Dokdonella fugitiva]|uniref:AAA ATPase-like protein n=1 Tax=Dokdonella fugitiva TaxID=328517 RepID=A0A4V2S346_9GAMM|nr:AAA family ATPase [Dokdonella fugitiva]TCO42930.1 AAA ATPase-like protein [Dokdonella fugitiva]